MSESKNKEKKVLNEASIKSKKDLKKFLLEIKDRILDGSAAPIYAVTAINYAMNTDGVYTYLDKENKELGRDIWLRIEKAGFQAERPVMLFG